MNDLDTDERTWQLAADADNELFVILVIRRIGPFADIEGAERACAELNAAEKRRLDA